MSATQKDNGPQQNYRTSQLSNLPVAIRLRGHTAVTVSIQRTKGSDVKYLESDQAYSARDLRISIVCSRKGDPAIYLPFHNCPKKSCCPAILVWL